MAVSGKPRNSLIVVLLVMAILSSWTQAESLKDHLRRIARDASPNTRVSPGKYLVELKSTRADRALESTNGRAFESTLHIAPGVKVLRKYESLFNGFAIRAESALELQRVVARPDVAAVYPVFRLALDPRERGALNAGADGKKRPRVELSTTLAMTGVDKARKELKVTGRGVKVAIIDSGLDYTHPAFARRGMKCDKLGDRGCRVVASHAFVGDDYDPDNGIPPVAGGDIMDCDSHGTHVAGIAAAHAENFTGVAYEADLLIYKVFGCTGATETDIILAAMERAHQDGAQVINLSIGGPGTLHDFPTATAATKLADKGVIVAAAQGNEGADLPLFASGAPGAGRKVLAVGSFDSNAALYNSTTVSGLPGIKESGYALMKAAVAFALDKAVILAPSPFSYDAQPGSVDGFEGDGCQPFASTEQFKGQVALLKGGMCGVDVKAANAKRAGATGLVVYGWTMDMAHGWLEEPNTPDLPIALITGQVGRAIWDHSSKPGAPSVSLTFHDRLTPVLLVDDGGVASGFSSFGPGGSLDIKPDISAPGGNIYSTVPGRNGSWAIMSGTSMSSPFIAGVAALAKQRFPRITYNELQRRLQSTARPGLSRIHNAPDSISRQGPGVVDAHAALTSTTVVSPQKLEWLDSNHRHASKVSITNRGSKPISFAVSHQPALTMTIDYFPPQSVKLYANVTTDRASLTIRPGRTAQVQVAATLDDPQIPNHAVLSGWIVFNSTEPHQPTIRLPYLLMKGNYTEYPMLDLDDPAQRFPFLTTSLLPELGFPAGEPNVTIKRFANETMGPFTLKGLDRPVAMISIGHYSRMVALALFDASTKTKLGYAATLPFAPQGNIYLPATSEKSAATGKRIFGWSGEYMERLMDAQASKVVPDGEYYFMAEAALPGTDDKWLDRYKAYWQSPKILVRRNARNDTASM